MPSPPPGTSARVKGKAKIQLEFEVAGIGLNAAQARRSTPEETVGVATDRPNDAQPDDALGRGEKQATLDQVLGILATLAGGTRGPGTTLGKNPEVVPSPPEPSEQEPMADASEAVPAPAPPQ